MVASQEFSSVAERCEVVRQAMKGNKDALSRLYTNYYGYVHSIVYSVIRNSHSADELTQDVFVVVMRKLTQLRLLETFPAWLASVARRTALNAISRKRGKLVNCLEETDFPLEDEAAIDPLEQLIEEELLVTVREITTELRPIDRRSLDFYYFRDCSVEEISRIEQAPVGTIKRRLHTARRRFAERLDADALVA